MSEHDCEWKRAIIDACVVDWIFTAEHESNPRKAVNDLLCWQQKIALDPAVSKDAHDLHARIKELETALTRLRDKGNEWMQQADEPQIERCPAKHPGVGAQCGLPKGHRDEHTMLIPTNMPWFRNGQIAHS